MQYKRIFFLRSILISGLVISFLFWNQCTSIEEEKDVLAQINDLTVTTTHFENAFKEYYYRTGQVLSLDFETKKAILENEFNRYVLVVKAQDLGFDNSQIAKNQEQLIERKVLVEEYLDQKILSDVTVTEEDLREYYIRFNTTLTASHIYSRTQEGIHSFKERLDEGESFESIAKEAFKNPYLANNGGDIGRFTTDEMDVSFENKAFSMTIGQISEPVKTSQGYSIIKLTDRVVTPKLTEYDFAQKKNQLQSYVLKKKKEVKSREYLADFIQSTSLNNEILEQLWTSFSQQRELAINQDSEFLNRFTSRNELLAKNGNYEFSVSDFASEYRIDLATNVGTIHSLESLKAYITGITYRSYLYDRAKEEKIHEQFLVKRSIEETFYDYLVGLVEDDLYQSVQNTPAELFSEYSENKDLYVKPLELNLSRIVLSNESKAEELLHKLKNREMDFESAVIEYSINNEDRFLKGEQGMKSIKEYGFLAPKLSDLQKDDLSEVIEYQSGEFHIYKCNNRVEARYMVFNEAAPQVDIYLKKQKFRALKEKTIEDIKKQYNAMVDGAKLKELNFKI